MVKFKNKRIIKASRKKKQLITYKRNPTRLSEEMLQTGREGNNVQSVERNKLSTKRQTIKTSRK